MCFSGELFEGLHKLGGSLGELIFLTPSRLNLGLVLFFPNDDETSKCFFFLGKLTR